MRVFTIAVILFLSIVDLRAQVPCDACGYKGITTNPSNPLNPEKSTKRNTFFDWTSLGQQQVFSQYWQPPYNYISSPFNQNGNLPLAHFINNPDRLPKDGWELIKYNLGFSESKQPNGLPNRNIYIVLYNKYRGILRVFVAANEVVSYNGYIIAITFSGGTMTNALSNASSTFALDQFESSPIISSISKHIPSAWAYADFTISYDPCSCFYESLMSITIDYLNTSTLKLKGSIDGELVSKDANNKVTDVKEDGYSFLKKAVAGGTAAFKTFDSFQSFANDQISAIDKEGKTNAQIAAAALETKNSINFFQGIIKSSKFLQTGLKAIPYLGAALSLVDAFIGGGNDGPQEVKIMPMALQANVKLEGTLEGVYPNLGATFSTPGSLNAACKNDDYYPYYNETLGIFNLMETPTYITVPPREIRVPDGSNIGFHWETVAGYTKMKDHIRYAVNPSAGMTVQELQAQIIIKDVSNPEQSVVFWSSPMVPITAIKDFIFQNLIAIGTNQRVFIKLFVNFKRDDAGSDTQNVLYVATYPVLPNKVGSFTGWNEPYSTNYSTLDLFSFPKDVTIESNTILTATRGASNDILLKQGQRVTGSYIITPGTKYRDPVYGYYYAPVDIVVSTSNASGFIAGNSIAVKQGVTIKQGVALTIGLPNGNFNKPMHQPSDVVKAFCESTAYKNPNGNPRALQRIGSDEAPTNNYTENESPENQIITAFPNPSSGNVTFKYKVKESGNVSLSIMDFTGNLIGSPLNGFQESGEYEFNYDLSAFHSGVYIYKLEINGMVQLKKLVVVK